MITYSVSDVAKMLGVNDETIRRWIRDGKLTAKRGLGRGGNSLLLEDVVAFANQPPRTYLLYLVSWLEQHNIPYQKVEDTVESADVKRKGAIRTGVAAATASAIATPVAAVVGPVGMAASLVGLAAAGTASALASRKGSKNKVYQGFTIQLTDVEEEQTSDIIRDTADTSPVELIDEDGFVVYENVTAPVEPQPVDDVRDPFTEDSFDIEEKIREEQLALIRLRQELAQIQAKIAVAEGQIEYYNLLRKK